MACGHRARGSRGGGGGQQVDFREVDSPGCEFQPFLPLETQPLWYKQGGVGAGQAQGQIQQEWGLQRVAGRSQPQWRIQGQDTHAWLKAPARPQSCPGRATHCDAGEKMVGVGPRPPGVELGFTEPSWKDSTESSLLPSCPPQGLGHQASPQPPQLDVHNWTWGTTPRAALVATTSKAICPDCTDSP